MKRSTADTVPSNQDRVIVPLTVQNHEENEKMELLTACPQEIIGLIAFHLCSEAIQNPKERVWQPCQNDLRDVESLVMNKNSSRNQKIYIIYL